MNKTAIITGVTGQDGSYLAEYLLEKDYKVVGVYRRSSSANNFYRIQHLLKNPRFKMSCGDITDSSFISRLLHLYDREVEIGQSIEIYHLAAQSHVKASFEQPEYTIRTIVDGTLNILEVMRSISPSRFKLYFAGSSEQFGNASRNADNKYNELSQFLPQSPYAIAKRSAFELCRLYRDGYGLFVCSGLLFNHESPRRGEQFVTRKITQYAAKLYKTVLDFSAVYDDIDTLHEAALKSVGHLRLGNINTCRDWGFAGDYVRAMYLMLQHKFPDDYVVATGETVSVAQFLEYVFGEINLDWHKFVLPNSPELTRPGEVHYLCGDARKINQILGWQPQVTVKQLAKTMLWADIDAT
jgi:GDPmannose 4,6-dehydratase